MSQKLNAAIAVIGIDIGKNSFHIVGHDHRGAIVLRSALEGISISDCRLVPLFFAEKSLQAIFGVLQHYLSINGHQQPK